MVCLLPLWNSKMLGRDRTPRYTASDNINTTVITVSLCCNLDVVLSILQWIRTRCICVRSWQVPNLSFYLLTREITTEKEIHPILLGIKLRICGKRFSPVRVWQIFFSILFVSMGNQQTL